MSDLNWWLAMWILANCGWNVLGVFLAAWRQPNSEAFLIAMIVWLITPLWVWAVPFSRGLRHVVGGCWYGMDSLPRSSLKGGA